MQYSAVRKVLDQPEDRACRRHGVEAAKPRVRDLTAGRDEGHKLGEPVLLTVLSSLDDLAVCAVCSLRTKRRIRAIFSLWTIVSALVVISLLVSRGLLSIVCSLVLIPVLATRSLLAGLSPLASLLWFRTAGSICQQVTACSLRQNGDPEHEAGGHDVERLEPLRWRPVWHKP